MRSNTKPSLWPLALVILATWALLACLPQTADVFMTARNLGNLFSQISGLIIVSVGMTCVILIRGIDLSVGAGATMSSVFAALLVVQYGLPAWLGMAAAMVVGGLVGLWHGLWIARLGLPAFVVTLSGFYTFRGIGLVATDSRALAPLGAEFRQLSGALSPAPSVLLCAGLAAVVAYTTWRRDARRAALSLPRLGSGWLVARLSGVAAVATGMAVLFFDRGMPYPVLVAGVVVAAGVLWTEHTRMGRHLYAIGGNPSAAHTAGIRVERATVWVYVVAGFCTALGGLVMAARSNGVTPGNMAIGLELDVITAVVIGGTSLMGGRGSIMGAMLGAVLFGTVGNGMNHLGINSNWQLILKGQLLMLAVWVDVFSKKRGT